MLPILLTLVAAYLIGSVSFAVLVSRLYGLPDPRSFGSGNPGATNVLRTGRKSAAALTLAGDAAKGAVAVLLAAWASRAYGLPDWTPALAALAVFAGHLWPVFFGFQGGKGVATALGVLLALEPWLGLACLATWLTVFGFTRISSLSALTAAGLAPLYAWLLRHDLALSGAMVALAVLIVWRHRANIRKLLRGEEAGFGKKV
jgi:glycerol-3-phosphate acyltransferase PlsY